MKQFTPEIKKRQPERLWQYAGLQHADGVA